ncbi:MAG: hypothetical protein VYE64_04300 [Planctomycetota bacterium]|nr:hypothetical protein [Planctomycetota bacterium]
MKLLLSAVVISAAWVGLVTDDGPDLTGVKCIVNGNAAAKADKHSEYQEGHVYFCCGNCKAKFDASPAKFTVKANHQLALTGQYVQVASPLGGKCAEGMSVNVGGVEVCFSNEKQMKRVADAPDLAAKAKMVFGKKAFAKGFKPKSNIDLADVKCMMMPAKGVKASQAVDYKGGKVFFCCKGCAGKFAKDPSKFTEMANQQLYATGQYQQTGCPISGGDVDDEAVVSVNGVAVKMCCGNCVKKVESQADGAAQARLVFSDKAFQKGFEKK